MKCECRHLSRLLSDKMAEMEDLGLLATHWALGTLVLIGLASSELAGAATIIALPIAALGVTLGALCEAKPKSSEVTLKKRKMNDVAEFLEIWFNILELLAAGATCARVASATMDYMSKGRLRDWLFGLESHSLGEPWPDVLGVTIVVVTTALFMLGLDRSQSLSLLLYVGLGMSLIFFIVIGSFHTDIIFWNWTEDFTLNNWGRILTAAALCSYAFPNSVPTGNQSKICLKYGCFFIIPLLCYLLIVVVFTLMSHFRETSGSAIPLVRVFEVRDVDWARPIMATCTIFASCIAMTEIIPSLCNGVTQLASREWKVLVSSLLYRNTMTGAPVLAIFAVGSLTSILAFACPLSYLVRLLNVSPLIKCALRSSRTLYARYKPEFIHEDLSVQHSNIQYSRLHKGQKKPLKPSPTKRLKTAFDIMPRFLRNSSFSGDARSSKGFPTTLEDKEYLLMDDYNSQSFKEHPDAESDSESDANEVSSICTDVEADTSSSTDIDAIVQEYKEQIQVTTVNNFAEHKNPTRLTSQTVLVSLLVIYASASMVTVGLSVNIHYLTWINSIVILVCAVIIFLMPRNSQNLPGKDGMPGKLFLCIPLTSTVLNVMLATTLLPDVWFGVVMWILGGAILFCRCDCCSCEGLYPNQERMRLQGPKKDCASTFSNQHNEHIDAVLITR